MNEENNIEQDPFETHGYKQGQEVLVDAEFLVGVLAFCRRVQDSQPKVAALLQYPKVVNVIKDKKNKEVLRVDIDWENHSKNSFANTAFTETGGVPIITDLGMYALQIENALTAKHLENINSGVALKLEQDGKGL